MLLGRTKPDLRLTQVHDGPGPAIPLQAGIDLERNVLKAPHLLGGECFWQDNESLRGPFITEKPNPIGLPWTLLGRNGIRYDKEIEETREDL